MDAKLIEQLDQRRYKYTLWQTIGFSISFVGVVAGNFVSGKWPLTVVVLIIFLGTVMFFVAALASTRNEQRIKSDPAIQSALNNELVRLYGYKSSTCAFYTVVLVSALLLIIDIWWKGFSAGSACLIIIYATLLSRTIAQLVYLKRS